MFDDLPKCFTPICFDGNVNGFARNKVGSESNGEFCESKLNFGLKMFAHTSVNKYLRAKCLHQFMKIFYDHRNGSMNRQCIS